MSDPIQKLKTAVEKGLAQPTPPTKGLLIAQESRERCNNLTDEERQRLNNRAMSIILGANDSKVPASRP